MTSFQRARILLFVPLLGLAVLSGCGGSSSSSDTTATTETTATADVTSAETTPADTSVADASAAETSAASAAAQPAASEADADAGKAFSDCLKQQGVELPEGFTPGAGGAGNPGSIPEGLDLAKLQPALAACQDKLPAGAGLPGLGAGGAGVGGADFSAYTTCLKDNGVAIPEPFDPSKLDLTDPKLTEAATTCQPLLPAGIPGVGAGVPSTTAAA